MVETPLIGRKLRAQVKPDGYKQRTHAYENKNLNKVVEHKTKIKD